MSADLPSPSRPSAVLQPMMRQARDDAAERAGVASNLRDAEVARLELLNDALDPIFTDVPAGIDGFDRGITRGVTPRLWVDMVAHVALDGDGRTYRFVQDTRAGRHTLAESPQVAAMTSAVAAYVARRLVEREHALSAPLESVAAAAPPVQTPWRMAGCFALGVVVGGAGLIALAWLLEPLPY